MRLLYFITASLLLIGCKDPQPAPPAPSEIKEPVKSTKEILTITAVGDMMLGSDFPNRSRMPKKDILLPLADSLRSGDFLIGNLEGVITNVNIPEKKCVNPQNCYVFRMPPGPKTILRMQGSTF